MTPYASLSYFGVALYPLLPSILIAWAGRLSRSWLLLITLVMLVVQYGSLAGPGATAPLQELWLVLGFGLMQYALGRAFLAVRASTSRRWPFAIALGLSFSPLVVTRVTSLLGTESLVAFLGISYMSFRAADVLFGIQDRLITSLPARTYVLFLFFFPTVSSGPIDRYRRFEADLQRVRSRAEVIGDLDSGVHHLFTGLLYKFILAALIKQYWLDPAASSVGLAPTLSYMYAYSLYLFFDFAGYSAFAVGISYLLGVHTPENFNRPFLARNILDFWNRWHLSLSYWLRDHVYMRFVITATKRRWFRDRYVGSYLGYLLSFGLMGAWHGLQPHYLLYGLYHALLVIGYDLFRRWNSRYNLVREGPLWRAGALLLTFNCVCFGFLLFSGHLTSPTPAAARSASLGLTPGAASGAIQATPNPIVVCDGSGLGATTISWTAAGVTSLHVRIDRPDGTIFYGGGPGEGSQATGKWVSDGTTFFLQDVSGDQSQTLASVTVRLAGCDPATGAPAVAGLGTAPGLAAAVPPRPASVLFGAWVGAQVNVAGDEQGFEQAVGKARAIRHWYWSADPINTSAAAFTAWSASTPPGAILMLSWAPAPADSSLDNVNAGQHDAYIAEWARALRDYDREIWLRPMWEDNAPFYWWSSGLTAETGLKVKYKLAFRRVVELFRQEGARNVKFVWSPSVRGDGSGPAILSYPGGPFVDWVGLDGYPYGSASGEFYPHFKDDYEELAALGKPMLVAETSMNLPDDAERARYVSNLLRYELPQRFPRFGALVWFNEPDWGDLLDPAYPLTLEAFRSAIADPYYAGR